MHVRKAAAYQIHFNILRWSVDWKNKQLKTRKRKKKSREYSCSVKSKVYGLGVANNVQELHFILTGEGADAVLVLEKKISKTDRVKSQREVEIERWGEKLK